MSAPVKRGPGRPRKHPLPEPVPEIVQEDAPEEPVSEAPTEKPTKSDDPRIGMEVHPTASHVGFDDGTQYLAAGGVITKRVE